MRQPPNGVVESDFKPVATDCLGHYSKDESENMPHCSKVFKLKKKKKKKKTEIYLVYTLSTTVGVHFQFIINQVMLEQLHPIRVDVAYVAFILIGWDRSHVTFLVVGHYLQFVTSGYDMLQVKATESESNTTIPRLILFCAIFSSKSPIKTDTMTNIDHTKQKQINAPWTPIGLHPSQDKSRQI